MKKTFATPARTPALKRNAAAMTSSKESKDSLQVYCRLRPLSAQAESCIKVVNNTTVQLSQNSSLKEYTFRRIFTEADSQKDVFDEVALPLVELLIKGQNGLLFTYGVTSSGKTYTMTGTKNNAGMMQRCVDVLFNSIFDYQAAKYIFKPDKMNGFEVQNEEEARKDRVDSVRKAAINKFNKLNKKDSQEDLTSVRSKEEMKLPIPDEDNAFAVFLTYTEVYNNYVYDLLENISETEVYTKPQSKLLREDASGGMYIHGVNEVEVKSAEEACEIFMKGQKRKRMAHTSLNTESSRSHSIFTIRLVQAPLDIHGEKVLQDKKVVGISQLSLVDLAGSERCDRTKNAGQRLNEASKINQSLMTLRTCLEILRENQQSGSNKMIPYREARLTQLFKNYFDGDGDIRMVVCVNPTIADTDENMLVMKFAEASQDILVKPTPLKTDLTIGLTPGRRRAQQERARALQFQVLHEIGENEPVTPSTSSQMPTSLSSSTNYPGSALFTALSYVPLDVNQIYNLNPLPEITDVSGRSVAEMRIWNEQLLVGLEERITKWKSLREDFVDKIKKFRDALIQQQHHHNSIKQDNEVLNAQFKAEAAKQKISDEKIIKQENQISSLKRKHAEILADYKRLRKETDQKDTIIQQYGAEKDKEKKIAQRMIAKTEKLAKEKENSAKARKEMEAELKDKENKLRKARKVLEDNTRGNRITTRSRAADRMAYESESDSLESAETAATIDNVVVVTSPSSRTLEKSQIVSPIKAGKATVVSNPRHGKTSSRDQWLDHRPTVVAPMNTVFQPRLKRRKSFTGVTSPKEVTKTSKYCLMTQNQDEDGCVETQFFKGDVVPTAAGGAQVIFNDVETLKQTSPISSPKRSCLV